MEFVTMQISIIVFSLFALSGKVPEFTIKRVIAFLVMLSGILGAILTFLIALPSNENVTLIIGVLVTAIAVILALIKMLKQINIEVEREVNNRL